MKSFQVSQEAFIDHIKDPVNCLFDEGIEDRRLGIYRELFFNNIKGFLSSGFPVLESLYTEEAWSKLARRFFAEHECRSPYFIDISKEFVEYLGSEYELTNDDPVFMQELAHYEWLELALSIRKETVSQTLWNGKSAYRFVQFSQLAELVSYQYPVHEISIDNQPSEASKQSYLVVYRDEQDEVKFSLVNAVSAHMLSLIQQSDGLLVEEIVQQMAAALPQVSPQQIEEGTKSTIETMLAQQILVLP